MALIATGVLSTRIQRIRTDKAALNADIQDVLVSCAYQAARGNPNYANQLLEAVRDSINIKGLTVWCETFAPLIVRADKFEINKGMRKQMAVECEEDFAPFEAECRKVNWFDMAAPQKAESIFAADEYVETAFERMAKKLNSNGSPDLAAEVKKLLVELYSTKAWQEMRAKADA